MRINITLSADLIEKIDARAKDMYITRSAYIATALVQKMQSDDALVMLPAFTQTLQDAIKLQKDKLPFSDCTTLGAEIDEAADELKK